MNKIEWPVGRKFAFTVFDDTDYATLEKVRPVYDFLTDIGLRTTKSVWPVKGAGSPLYGGDTCENEDYLLWLKSLKQKGFEIGYHMNTYHSSNRTEIIAGLDRYKELFGKDPSSMANHSGCLDNIYWGSARLDGINKLIYNLITGFKFHNKYRGHIRDDIHYWGDICNARIRYCRNFVFDDINTLRVCPFMPYHDPTRPYVNYWFASSEGGNVESFVKCINESAQDRLEQQKGACIMYTHFGCNFYDNDELHKEFKRLMGRLSQKKGWFVPVTTLLDFLLKHNGNHVITKQEKSKLERQWLFHKLRVGHS